MGFAKVIAILAILENDLVFQNIFRQFMKDQNVTQSDESRTSTSMVREAQSGAALAWDRLLRAYSGRVFKWAKKSGFSEADAADLMQTTFAKVFRALPKFNRDRDGGTFRGWLRTIALHTIIDARRKTRRNVTDQATGGTDHQRRINDVSFEADEEISSHFVESEDLRARALRFVQASVRDNHWSIFVQVSVEGRDPAEVANDFGLSRAGIYTIKHRIAQQIRETHDKLSAEER